MRKKTILFTRLIIIGLLFTAANSCKKDDPIVKKDVAITWANPADITVGTLLSAAQLNATANQPGAFVYTPSIGAILSVGVNQNLTVDFTPTDAANYSTATKTVTINVMAKKVPIITWANPTDIISGTALSAAQLNATADVAGTFVYTPASGTVLSVGAPQNLKVDFTPTDAVNYNTATKTVTINVIAIGSSYQGGIIAYIFVSGEPGYVEGETHGLIAAKVDQSTGISWAITEYQGIAVPGTLTTLGSGSANTDKIITQNGAGSTYAAGLARAYTGGNYTDWYLPSQDELNKLYLNRVAVGGFTDFSYWSSTELNSSSVWIQYFYNGDHGNDLKKGSNYVRAVRTF
jgi:2-keto-3-deoxy-6-phosphogluconate aldolase